MLLKWCYPGWNSGLCCKQEKKKKKECVWARELPRGNLTEELLPSGCNFAFCLFFASSHKNLLSTQMMLCQCSRDGKSLKAQPEAKPQARQGVLKDTEEPQACERTNLNPNARDTQQKQGMAWLRQPARAALLPLGASLLFCLLTLNWSARPRCTCMDCTAPFQHEIPSWC